MGSLFLQLLAVRCSRFLAQQGLFVGLAPLRLAQIFLAVCLLGIACGAATGAVIAAASRENLEVAFMVGTAGYLAIITLFGTRQNSAKQMVTNPRAWRYFSDLAVSPRAMLLSHSAAGKGVAFLPIMLFWLALGVVVILNTVAGAVGVVVSTLFFALIMFAVRPLASIARMDVALHRSARWLLGLVVLCSLTVAAWIATIAVGSLRAGTNAFVERLFHVGDPILVLLSALALAAAGVYSVHCYRSLRCVTWADIQEMTLRASVVSARRLPGRSACRALLSVMARVLTRSPSSVLRGALSVLLALALGVAILAIAHANGQISHSVAQLVVGLVVAALPAPITTAFAPMTFAESNPGGYLFVLGQPRAERRAFLVRSAVALVTTFLTVSSLVVAFTVAVDARTGVAQAALLFVAASSAIAVLLTLLWSELRPRSSWTSVAQIGSSLMYVLVIQGFVSMVTFSASFWGIAALAHAPVWLLNAAIFVAVAAMIVLVPAVIIGCQPLLTRYVRIHF